MNLPDFPNGSIKKSWNFDFIDNYRDNYSESDCSPKRHSIFSNSIKNSWNIIKDTNEEYQRTNEKIPFQRLSIFSNPNIQSKRNSICLNLNEEFGKESDFNELQRWNLNQEEQENFNQIMGLPQPSKHYEVVTTTSKSEEKNEQSILSQNTQPKTPNKKKRKIAKNKPEKKKSCCNCKKSKCLRLYCVCFQTSNACSSECSCNNCLNKEEFNEVRQFVIQKTKEINPLAFGQKYGVVSSKGKDKVLHTRGCRCKKIGCDRNYCECFKAGVGCSNMCQCLNCENQQVTLQKEDVKKIFQKKRRKKHKIVIGEVDEQKQQDNQMNFVSYVPYKRDPNQQKKSKQLFFSNIRLIFLILLILFFKNYLSSYFLVLFINQFNFILFLKFHFRFLLEVLNISCIQFYLFYYPNIISYEFIFSF